MELLGSIAAPVIGGLLGGASRGGSTSSQMQIDPEVKKNMYSLLGDVQNTYKSQLAQPNAMNPLMNTGIAQQQAVYTDPAYTQGYGQMRNLGLSLLGGGVAGNPFTQGGGQSGASSGGGNPYVQNYLTPQVMANMTPPPAAAPAPAQAPAPRAQNWEDIMQMQNDWVSRMGFNTMRGGD